ncbi:MAG TPA: hypothetical protein VH853_17705 [Polyangia bacterium]|jgi:hypothetical protein|nr:hypothetical protein [Polyangia bacterium]
MKRLIPAVATALLVMSAASRARAEDRPSEQDLFGGSSSAPASPTPPAKPTTSTSPAVGAPGPPPPAVSAPPATAPASEAAGGTARDQELLGGSGDAKFLADYVAPDNPLQIGGQLYLRMQTTASGGQAPADWSLSAPSLLDLYLDARPNPRVRGFILGRMSYDPTLSPNNVLTSTGQSGSNGAFANPTSPTGFSTFSNTRGPATLLDQMWIRFDIFEHVFVTAGKQHVRWGTGRFWQPTDYLHQEKRNPLDVFDARPGTTMLKLNIPWEEKGWNFYGFLVAEDPNAPTPTLGQVAGAFRAEVVLGGVELGADTYLRRGERPRYGFDLSTGIYDFDVYADVAVRPGDDFLHEFPAQGSAPAGLYGFTGYETQAVGGINYSRKYNDNDMWTVGVEYFYNHPGYSDASAYPALLQAAFFSGDSSAFPFFYLGRQYGAVYLTLPAPYSWNYTTFTLSTLGNLSDESFITRLDYSVTVLTHLSVEAFAGVHYGHLGGEFRFQLPASLVAANQAAIASIPNSAALTDYPVVDLGVALRLKI